ncbi:hypothetical protein SISNIDRAFT_485342 [Sistotremastrum niveocremeum HHB9708]|uniref:Fungal-type protein kinase domain-containing protein n=1 Tax=Sistotremastrum niveocremeum HHB9708 TaxID=1314777 RepID=A0A164V1G1_9AGAM|nr:hypothetical protein SISNIDRAFT_485342 [Sistotremastrum niveocremeum HHB9708]
MNPTTPPRNVTALPPTDTPMRTNSSPLLHAPLDGQAELLKKMEAELRGSVALSTTLIPALVAKSFMPHTAAQFVRDNWDKKARTWRGWPRGNPPNGEKGWYPPLARLCNDIHEAGLPGQKRQPDDPYFLVTEERLLLSSIDEIGGVKPDLIFGPDRVYPGDCATALSFIEVKIDKLDLQLYQSATYARALFAHRHDLLYVYGVLADKTQARFARFDRSGIVVSEPVPINDPNPEGQFLLGISGLTRLVSGSELRDASMPRTGTRYKQGSPDAILVSAEVQKQIGGITGDPKSPLFLSVLRTIYANITVRGRATRIYEVGLPDGRKFLMKDAWKDIDRLHEGSVLSKCSGRFGLPHYVAHWYPGDHKTDFPVSGALHPRRGPLGRERREHVRTLMNPPGSPLSVYRDYPEIVLWSVHSTILGHWGLRKSGYVHRDVSCDNIIVLEAPIPSSNYRNFRDIPTRHFATGCAALLIDLDMAIEVDSQEDRIYLPVEHRSGANAFMSLRLQGALKTRPRHTFHDDLESFFWVLLWVAFGVAPQPESRTGRLSDAELERWEGSIEELVRTCISKVRTSEFRKQTRDKYYLVSAQVWDQEISCFSRSSEPYVPVCRALVNVLFDRHNPFSALDEETAYNTVLDLISTAINGLEGWHERR